MWVLASFFYATGVHRCIKGVNKKIKLFYGSRNFRYEWVVEQTKESYFAFIHHVLGDTTMNPFPKNIDFTFDPDGLFWEMSVQVLSYNPETKEGRWHFVDVVHGDTQDPVDDRDFWLQVDEVERQVSEMVEGAYWEMYAQRFATPEDHPRHLLSGHNVSARNRPGVAGSWVVARCQSDSVSPNRFGV